jgi:hypothetical protein
MNAIIATSAALLLTCLASGQITLEPRAQSKNAEAPAANTTGGSPPSSLSCNVTVRGKVLTALTGASASTPCIFRLNDSTYTFAASPTLTITAGGGSGVAHLYLNRSGGITAEVSSMAAVKTAASGLLSVAVTTPAFPKDALSLATIAINEGSWGIVTDQRPTAGGREALTAGAGIAAISNGVIAIDPTVVQRGADNAFTGANDFSSGTSQTLLRRNGDPTTGCDAAGSVGKVYVRADGPTGDNLWICENNGGKPQWVKMAPANVQSPGLGYFAPSASLVNGGFQPLTANTSYFYQVTLPFPMTVRQVTMQTNGGGGAAQAAAVGLYDASCNLLASATGRAVGLNNSGVLVFPLAAPQSLPAGVYHFGIAVESAAAGLSVSGAGSPNLLLNPGSDTRLFLGANPPSGTGASYTMPSRCGNKAQNANPSLNFVWLP